MPSRNPPEQTSDPQPSTYQDGHWLHTERRQGSYPLDTDRVGKWMLFISVSEIDTWWAKIKKATEEGQLGCAAKVATAFHSPDPRATRLICVYTYDGEDKDDVMRVREELRRMGITRPISYKLDSETRAGHYSAEEIG